MAEQTLATHRLFVPVFHYVAFPLILVNLVWSVADLIRDPSSASIRGVLVGLALAFVLIFSRIFALKAQNRVIRLEERLRFARLLPPDLLDRLDELKPGQWVGLRFASDGEVAKLCTAALDEGLSGEEIKKRIEHWRADHFRL